MFFPDARGMELIVFFCLVFRLIRHHGVSGYLSFTICCCITAILDILITSAIT